MSAPPRTWVSASAIGYYGDRGDAMVSEQDPPGQAFLPSLCSAWEAATALTPPCDTRIVHLRIGIVLSLQGGVLPAMKRPFDWGVGGPLGDGTQVMSWITLEDLCGIIRYIIRESSIHGAVNAVTPHAVTNAEFSSRLAAILHRPALLRLPQPLARMVLGEMSDALLFASVRVKPAVLEEKGFPFLFPTLAGALNHLLR